MNSKEQFCYSTFAEQTHLAERELVSFVGAVNQLYGSEEAELSVEDWLDEAQLMDSPPLSTGQNWRAVTIAASARLANRLTVTPQHERWLSPRLIQGVVEIPSSNCSSSDLLRRMLSGRLMESETPSDKKRSDNDPKNN